MVEPLSSVGASIAAVIATVGRPETLETCLNSLAAQTIRPAEVVVVHCGSDSGTRTLCEQDWPSKGLKVRYLTSLHQGAALQRDLGVHHTTEPLILFADDDVEFDRRWVESLAAVVTGDPEVGAAMGAVTNHPWAEPTRLWRLYRRLVATADKAREPGAVVGALVPNGFPPAVTEPIRAEWLGGGVTLLRRDVYLAVNGFAGHYRGSSPSEDVDLGYRVSRRWKVWYVPAARCVHHQSTSGRESLAHYNYLSMRSRYGFCRVSAGMGRAAAIGHILLWAAFQTVGDLGQLRRGRPAAGVWGGVVGRLRGAWSCIGWDPAAERFPDWHDTHGRA